LRFFPFPALPQPSFFVLGDLRVSPLWFHGSGAGLRPGRFNAADSSMQKKKSRHLQNDVDSTGNAAAAR